MTNREVVLETIKFGNPDRLAYDFPPKYGSDFTGMGMNPSPDMRTPSGVDEWGAVWENIGVSQLGEVKDFPLKDWADWDKLNIPDIRREDRWEGIKGARERAGDKFLLGSGISIYERVHFIRGLENTWADIYEAPEQLQMLLDILVDMNLVAIEKYAQEECDGLIFCDDWGLQDRLMINPVKWREIWKPRYARIFKAAHDANMCTFMHSCGYTVDILDDLIEVGLDVIHMDQQENMGLELLGRRFGGRITFFAGVDIQFTMSNGSHDDIRAYCRKMAECLGRPNGGFIPRWYTDPVGVGHSMESIEVMCEEFLKISREKFGC